MAFFTGVLAVIALSATQAMGYDPTCSNNLAVYWGQNSYGVGNPNDATNWQKTISTYCQDTVINVIPIAFVNLFFSTGGLPHLDSPTGSTFPGTNLANCQFLAAGIEACQAKGKLVTISLGGAVGSVLTSDAEGVTFANNIWNLFFGGSRSTCPFGSVVLDGVDLDIEVGDPTGYAAFVNRIRALSASSSKHYYITAAPQCPFPDQHIGGALDVAFFDAVYVQVRARYSPSPWPNRNSHRYLFQFYNNDCTWDEWAKTVSPNPNVKIFIGAGGGYVDATTLGSIALQTRMLYSSFGGVMLWDASQAYGTSDSI
ncbi:glycoside hydrolase family 18 protein [Mycena rebaudengoi]|nr:glycoside hydrolase family 18 protein [Mycena rebaudengoi]